MLCQAKIPFFGKEEGQTQLLRGGDQDTASKGVFYDNS